MKRLGVRVPFLGHPPKTGAEFGLWPGYGEVPFWWWTGEKFGKKTLGKKASIKATLGLNGKSYSASCSTAIIPTKTPNTYRVYLYFPPKSGKFDGFSDVVGLHWDGISLAP